MTGCTLVVVMATVTFRPIHEGCYLICRSFSIRGSGPYFSRFHKYAKKTRVLVYS